MSTKHVTCTIWMGLYLLSHVGATAASSLDLLIAQALENNPSLQAMTSQVQAAQARQREARAAYYPQLGASANLTHTDNAPQAFMMQLNQRQLDMGNPMFDPNHPDDTTNIQVSLGVRYPLMDGTRAPQRHMARLQATLASENLTAGRNALVHAVTRDYYQVLEARAFTAVQEASQASFAESLRVAEERYAAGAVVRTDVLNLEVQLAQANENLIRARNGVKRAITALHATTGIATISAENLQEPEAHMAATDMHGIPIAQRSELAMRRLQRDLAAQQTRRARAGKRPLLHAFGSVSWDGAHMDDREQSYIAGIALEWNWLDGGRSRARVDAARALQGAADAHMQDTILQLQMDAKQAALQLQEAWERIHVTQHAVTSADEAVRMTRALYREGATEVANLLTAERALTETRMRATAARYDYLIAQSNAKRAAGQLGTQRIKNE